MRTSGAVLLVRAKSRTRIRIPLAIWKGQIKLICLLLDSARSDNTNIIRIILSVRTKCKTLMLCNGCVRSWGQVVLSLTIRTPVRVSSTRFISGSEVNFSMVVIRAWAIARKSFCLPLAKDCSKSATMHRGCSRFIVTEARPNILLCNSELIL